MMYTIVLRPKGYQGTDKDIMKNYSLDSVGEPNDIGSYLVGPDGIVWNDYDRDKWDAIDIVGEPSVYPTNAFQSSKAPVESTAPKPDARILPSNEDLSKLDEDQLISTFIPVARLIGRYSEDAKQEAILGLIEAVGRLKTIQHGGIKQYLCTCIKGRVRGYIEKLPIVHVPRYIYKELKEQEKEEDDVETNSIFDFISIDNTDTTGGMDIPVSDFLDSLIAKDMFNGIIKRLRPNSTQLNIVLLRLEGKTDAQIGIELGLSQQVVHYQRKQIKEKIKSWLRGN